MDKAYTLKTHSETDQKHLFEGDFSTLTCTSDNESICKKMEKDDAKAPNDFQCLSRHDARIRAAEIGDEVCGTCVSHLYASY